MEHHAQVLLAFGISAALCFGAWVWARRRLPRLSNERSEAGRNRALAGDE